jgi:hypothetical protein
LSLVTQLPCSKTDTFVVLLYPQRDNFSVPTNFDAFFANIRANPLDFSARLKFNITDVLSVENLEQEGGALVRITGICNTPAASTNGTTSAKPPFSYTPFEGASSALVADSILLTLGLGLVWSVLGLF